MSDNFFFLSSVEGIVSFSASNGDFVYKTELKNVVYYEKILFSDVRDDLYNLKDFILFNHNSNLIIYSKLSNTITVKEDLQIVASESKNKDRFFVVNSYNILGFIKLDDINNLCVLDKIDYNWEMIYADNSFFCLVSENKINVFNYHSGSLWAQDISKFNTNGEDIELSNFNIENVIGTFNEILWLFLNNGELIGLESKNGKLLFRTGKITTDNFYGNDPDVVLDSKMTIKRTSYHIDESAGKMKSLFFRGYSEIDLNKKKPEIEFWALIEQMRQTGLKELHFHTSVDENGDIYFIDSNMARWGLFNTKTKTITYVSEKITIPDRPDAFTQLKQIKYAGGKVFVLDSNRTLHIFEKESD